MLLWAPWDVADLEEKPRLVEGDEMNPEQNLFTN